MLSQSENRRRSKACTWWKERRRIEQRNVATLTIFKTRVAMKYAQLYYAIMLAAVAALRASVIPVSAFVLPPKCRPTIVLAASSHRQHELHCSDSLFPITRRETNVRTGPLVTSSSSSRRSASKTETAISSSETILKRDVSSSSRAALVALGLILALQTAVPKPSHATSYGQFGASVSPPKTAVNIARNSGAITRTTKAGTTICQPISAVSTLNSNFSNKCKESEVSPDGETISEQAIEHQKLLADLEQEPDFYIYFSAFLASTISTLIIHPLDTWKVTNQIFTLLCFCLSRQHCLHSHYSPS